MEEKTRYSDEELLEFKELILAKLETARANLTELKAEAFHTNSNGTEDTSPVFKAMEDESSNVQAKEENARLAQRQQKYIKDLEAALVRIENKTYGICRVTGKLIPKERLKLVPHATLSIEAKMQQNKKR
ncbi:MAG: TraR/DksA family transcriptional regulator [Bacteroidales bacterium]|nr:TraR/DksA family transcriptional regulator [Bacteroidales bacterium]